MFAPERWLGDNRFANDDLAACQPFSLGPRGCLGKVSQVEKQKRGLLLYQLGTTDKTRRKNLADLVLESCVRGNAVDHGTNALEF